MQYAILPKQLWLSAMMLALFLSAPAPGQQDTNPIVAQIKASLKDPAKPFTLLVRFQIKKEAQEKFEAAFGKASKATHKEKGVITYDLNRDAKDPTRYVVYERWKSLADLEAHLRMPHTTALLGELNDILAGMPEFNVLTPAGE
jgi:quinol monooxygenase YgiN